jgi:HSP20 family protein
MSLVRWNQKQGDPFQEIFDLDSPFMGLSLFPLKNTGKTGNWFPTIDVDTDENNVYVKADLPGLRKEDIAVSIDDNVLSIKGERKFEKTDKNKQYHVVERSYGAFERSITLGTNVDATNIKANYKDGVLEITIPKSEKAKAKQILIEDK